MKLPIELLEVVALHLIAQACPLPPRRPPISDEEEVQESHQEVGNVGQLWRAPASHPVRRLSQVCATLRPFVRKHMWREVYLRGDRDLQELELLYRYIRCVDGSVLSTWTQHLTYSNWVDHWNEAGCAFKISELFYDEPDWIGEERENLLHVDAQGKLVIEEEGELLDWPVDKRFLDVDNVPRPTRADIWALHRFILGQLTSVERLCWRSMVDPGTMWRGSSLMHVIGQLPKLQRFEVDQTYLGGWFFARNLLTLTHLPEFWLDCFVYMEGEPSAEWCADWGGDIDQPTIDGEEKNFEVDHRKRFLTTCALDKLITTHFGCFDDPEVLAALACIHVVAREGEHHESYQEDFELGQAGASLRPALLARATPGMLTAQDVRLAAASDPRLARIKNVLEGAAEEVARRFNARMPRPAAD